MSVLQQSTLSQQVFFNLCNTSHLYRLMVDW